MTNKTQPTTASPKRFIQSVEHEKRREDAKALLELFERVTQMKPVMWGDSMIGFGKYAYKYASGREGEHFLTGYSPRKQNTTVYIMPGFSAEKTQKQLAKLGKVKTSSSCLYINKLEDIDLKVLESMIKDSIKEMRKRYPDG